MGLKASREIVLAHGGDMRLESRCENGATVYVEFPTAEAAHVSRTARLGNPHSPPWPESRRAPLLARD